MPSHELPPEAWSDGINVRFENNKVLKGKGHVEIFDPPSVAPYWVLYAPGLVENYWLYAGSAKVYAVDQGGTHTDLTRTVGGDYAMSNDLLWNGGILGGIPIINNGVDVPQRWAEISDATKLDDLPNWPALTTARIIRPFKSFLFAFDITVNSVRSPHKVKWSHSADPGTIPDSWDHTDATKDAGETELTDAARGFIVDAKQLGDLLLIYKQASIWGVQFTGGAFIFRFFSMFDGVGAFSKNCIAQVGQRGTPRHFVFTGDDIIVHDGRTYDSVINRRLHRWLLDSLNPDTVNRAFCVTNYPERECWFCFPAGGADWPNTAFVWSWEDGAISIRELGETSFIGIGNVAEDTTPIVSWNSDSGMWDDDVTIWSSIVNTPNEQRLLQADPVNTKLYEVDTTEQFNSINMTAFVERKGLAVVGQDRNREPKVDYSVRKLVTRMWPKLTGGPIHIRVGGQDTVDDTVVWQAPQFFDPAVQRYIDFTVNHRLLAFRFESTDDVTWELEGYDLEMVLAGNL